MAWFLLTAVHCHTNYDGENNATVAKIRTIVTSIEHYEHDTHGRGRPRRRGRRVRHFHLFPLRHTSFCFLLRVNNISRRNQKANLDACLDASLQHSQHERLLMLPPTRGAPRASERAAAVALARRLPPLTLKRMQSPFGDFASRPTHRPSVRIRPEVATRRRHERRLKRLDHTRGG